MSVQVLEHLPRAQLDITQQRVLFDLSRFYEELPAYFEKADDPQTFQLTKELSHVYHR